MNNPFAPHYAFTRHERKTLTQSLRPSAKQLRGWFAGHIHRWAHYRFAKAGGVSVYETKANKSMQRGGFRLVKVHAP